MQLSVGMEPAPDFARGHVVSEHSGRAVIELPADNWGENLPLLLSSVVAGEAFESRQFTRCRLVDLELAPAWLPGPAFSAPDRVMVGAIVKPSLGLSPHEVGEVVAALVRGGAEVVKDDEMLGDPAWCPLEERVKAVVPFLDGSVVYCANVSGPGQGLLDRARRAVELGATGVMVNAFAQGLDAVLGLRRAGLGVPILAHRVGSGPWARNDRFGVAGAVIARLTRLAGADFVQVGAFGGRLFDSDDDVRAQLRAVREPLAGIAAPVAMMGGGLGPDNVRAQAEAAGGTGLLFLVGSRGYAHPGGVEAGVRATYEALG